jgi:hypothetical protein
VSAVGAAIASSLSPSFLLSFSPCRLFWGIGRGRVKQQHSGVVCKARRGAVSRVSFVAANSHTRHFLSPLLFLLFSSLLVLFLSSFMFLNSNPVYWLAAEYSE